MGSLITYNFCILGVIGLNIYYQIGLYGLSLGILIVALFLPIIVILKELFNLGDDYEREGMLPAIIEGFRNNKETRKESRWMFYSVLFWIILGIILLMIDFIFS